MSIHQPLEGRVVDLGPLLQLPCTRCDVAQWFHLKRHSTSLRILGFEFSKSSVCSLHCAKCDYELDLSAEDAEMGLAFLPVVQEFIAGQLSEASFLAKVGDVGFSFLKQFAEMHTNWVCPACGEESPLTFVECWSCGQKREGNPEEEEDGPAAKTPYLDQVLSNDGGPFGSMRL